jgi:NTP pyrophosphatase (non-canonical NTP hydrolase)
MQKTISSEAGSIKGGVFSHATNVVSAQIGEWADRKGFRDDWKLADMLEQLAEEYPEIDIEEGRMILFDAARAIRINVVGMKLMLMVSELAEGLETLRDVGVEGIQNGEGNYGEELADAMIRLMDNAHMLGLPVGEEIIKKIAVNENRPHKHGRKA